MIAEFKFMKEALSLAKLGKGQTYPGPMVGCVIVKDGSVVAKGYHAKAGTLHAERKAIVSYEKDNGVFPVGCDFYVNLEPCSHNGKTLPCTDIIIEKKIKRVFIGMRDPNPLVNGKEIEKLKEAGVEVIEDILLDECLSLNKVFIKHCMKQSPYLTLKIGMTLDGLVADQYGDANWITSSESRKMVHQMRSGCDSLLTGIGSIKIDNPALNIRLNGRERENRIVILDKDFECELDAKVIKANAPSDIYIIVSDITLQIKKEKVSHFGENGVNVLPLRLTNGYFSNGLLELLSEVGIYHLLVEAGPKIVSSFIENSMADALSVLIAPKILGTQHKHRHFSEMVNIEKLILIKNLKTAGVANINGDVFINYTL